MQAPVNERSLPRFTAAVFVIAFVLALIGQVSAVLNGERVIFAMTGSERASYADGDMHAPGIDKPGADGVIREPGEIKVRSEGGRAAYLTNADIIVLLVPIFALGLAAILVMVRKEWKRPLVTGAFALTVLLIFIFMRPALWVRGLLDGLLFVSLGWSYLSSRYGILVEVQNEVEQEQHDGRIG